MNSDYPSKQTIQVAGVIASGKTTFAQLFSTVPNTHVVLEQFAQNPFLDTFYRDPPSVAFELETSFVLLHAYAERVSPGPLVICDYAAILDRAYSRVTLEPAQIAAFDAVWQYVESRQATPALIVHLTCSADVALRRIRERGRQPEHSITYDYLEALDAALRRELVRTDTPCLEVNSEWIDFRSDTQVQEKLINNALAMLYKR